MTTPETHWLSRTECTVMRGVAILAIVLHNYCHWLRGIVRENEFTFQIENVRGMWYQLLHPDGLLPIHLLSFLGHYGMPLFVLLSGYGLAVKYGQEEHLPVGRFVRYHYLKLLGMLIVGLVAFTMVDMMTRGAFHYRAMEVLAQLAMVINLFPEPHHTIWPGPFWFFGLIMQLYIIYILLIHRRHWLVPIVLVMVCWAVQVGCNPQGDTLNYLRYNCISGMLPFVGGVMLARMEHHPYMKVWRNKAWGWHFTVALLLTVLVIPVSVCFHLWLWGTLIVPLAMVSWIRVVPSSWQSPMAWVGGISAAMFVSHPIARKVFIPLSHHQELYDGLVLYIVAVMVLAWGMSLLLNKVKKPTL
ncbi:MAG: acyltransferase [Prevotella sp.]